jgi:hypothetical protein
MSKHPILLATIVAVWCSTAAAQPTVIPRLSRAPQDAERTFRIVQNYLSDPAHGLFTVVRADHATHTIVAERHSIDTQNWGEWAYCKLGPEQMLDTLENGAVTLTVKIKDASGGASDLSVTADFKGTYGLGGSEVTAQCVSKGVLENRIIQAAGAAPEGA